ncbi:hypothetical protein [Variovorax sp. RA8]|uniref:hypothetical protein n=1 Tax=Variovorax sp. (strain JCM 16519 / RA8) TaxID=662548 RepID=UPI0013A54FF7|nr:hypothetical protein [Variovorax sp. RA8]
MAIDRLDNLFQGRTQDASERLAASSTSDPRPGYISKDGVAQSATWNYWLGRDNSSRHLPSIQSGPLALHVQSHLLFRLSLLDLSTIFVGIGGFTTAVELTQAIESSLKDETRQELSLEVLLSPLDSSRLELSASRIPLKVDLAKVRSALAKPLPRPGDAHLEEVLARALIAQFSVDFKLKSPGDHQLAIAILDASTGFPLQSMLVDLRTGSTWPDNLKVRGNGQSVFASAGHPFDITLLLYGQGAENATTPSKEMHAWLAYRDKSTGKFDFLNWKTDASLVGLTEMAGSFGNTLGSLEWGPDLLKEGFKLGRVIFDPPPDPREDLSLAADANIENAASARALLVAASQYGPGSSPPTMLVGLMGGADVKGSFASTVLPVGALGVQSGETTVHLGERFALALLLNGLQMNGDAPCPSDWYLALPKDNEQKSGPLFDALTDLRPALGRWNDNQVRRQSSSLGELSAWMDAPPKGTKDGAFVMAYLGHHSESRLFIEQGLGGVSAIDVRRAFVPSSLAILNACNSAMPRINDGTLVGRLAKRNVAATIATTSPISGRLAAAYMDCLSAVLQERQSLRVGEAHTLAIQCLYSPEGGRPWGKNYNYSGAALKYILIGNPFQRICSPKPREQPMAMPVPEQKAEHS